MRVKPNRFTVDLYPNDYDLLRDVIHSERMTRTDDLRAVVRLLEETEVGLHISKSVGQ